MCALVETFPLKSSQVQTLIGRVRYSEDVLEKKNKKNQHHFCDNKCSPRPPGAQWFSVVVGQMEREVACKSSEDGELKDSCYSDNC